MSLMLITVTNAGEIKNKCQNAFMVQYDNTIAYNKNKNSNTLNMYILSCNNVLKACRRTKYKDELHTLTGYVKASNKNKKD